MTTKKRQISDQDIAQNDVSEIAGDANKINEISSNKIIEFENDTKGGTEMLQHEAKELNLNIQHQLKLFKQDLLKKFDQLKAQLDSSQKEYIELKVLVGAEINSIIEDLAILSKELKADVSELSSKHKLNLTKTLKRSKENTLEVWKKVIPHKSLNSKDATTVIN
ncbi:hypothetical protein B9T31_09035 [Acinetobacter sp. ANC 4558]|uniref:hypothetical protein n=1 Tax=Acinetobacter sp. ANC 4558 TaxID=1977876 RepID=UPI000A32B6BF|nr:hypothetical protein [Acinetobacter sp. ANC 4558]OTG86173.1 hypothetical protein B9T31_09035 [Acinetobacter sp. ANC 4558]